MRELDCTCDRREPLCDACIAQHLSWLEGVAACRGSYWAASVLRKLGPLHLEAQPWPSYEKSERVRRLALLRVGDMSRDTRLREVLARVCAKSAAEEFERLAKAAVSTRGR